MKLFIYISFLFLFSVESFGQEFKESEIPSVILSSFKDKYTAEGKSSWFREAGIYTVTFKSEGQNVVSSFTTEGKWVDTKYEIAPKELPGQILTYVNSNFKDAKIKEASLRESVSESDHYYVALKKEGVEGTADLYFDMKGGFTKQNVPDDFYKSTGTDQSVTIVPPVIYSAFKEKYPEAAITTWKTDSSLYTAYFLDDGMNGRAEFIEDGTWSHTKYEISEKELPGSITSQLKSKYNGYKVKTCEMVEEPGTTSYYYLMAKKEGIGQPSIELYYSLTGTLIKKVATGETNITDDTELNTTSSPNDDDSSIKESNEVLDPKEIPSKINTYIKRNYLGYSIKEAVLAASETGSLYIINIKKDGKKITKELTFDISGKFIEEKEEE